VAHDRSEPRNTDILPDVTTTLTSLLTPLDVPEFWDTPAKVDKLEAILLLGGVPLLLCVVIAFLVYAPSIVRGERIAPGHAGTENQWLGGPRKSAGELAAPDSEDSQAGGASGRW
jgi:hypothetical protein